MARLQQNAAYTSVTAGAYETIYTVPSLRNLNLYAISVEASSYGANGAIAWGYGPSAGNLSSLVLYTYGRYSMTFPRPIVIPSGNLLQLYNATGSTVSLLNALIVGDLL